MPRKPVRLAPRPSLRALGAGSATDDELDLCMAAVAGDGDKAAFGRLVQHFAPRLIGLFAHNRGARAEAEAIALETLVALWRDAAFYDPRQSTLAAFVFVLARNVLRERDAGAELASAAAVEPLAGDNTGLARATARLRAALENGM
ncbi:MAG TPA: hypothetical protein VN715_16365 [Roseiarcus sp.]|nr:hypothetical protein [Roseiarcus sp.]